MSANDRKEMRNFSIILNMCLGVYNLLIFTGSGSILNLIIGSLNIGVFIFFRHKLRKLIRS